MERIWLKSYVPGVPAEINADAYHSLVEILEESCTRYRTLPAFYNLGTTITFKQFDDYARDFAAYLQQILKLKKGRTRCDYDAECIAISNCTIWYFACWFNSSEC